MTYAERIERVARAIADHNSETTKVRWESGEFHYMARAAIEAMREPTDTMVEEAWASANAEDAAGVWRDMIDAALTE